MKILTLFILLALSALLAGIYGAVHDQIAYTISPEFFTEYRFKIFDINPDMNDRLGAAIVGFKNTWKVGLILGFIISLVGLLHPDARKMFRYSMQAFLISIFTALLATLIGVIYIRSTEIPPDQFVVVSGSLESPAKFSKVVMITNFAYVGAIIGMFLGIGWQVYQTKKYKSTVD